MGDSMIDADKTREVVADHVKRLKQQRNDPSWRGASEMPTAEEIMRRQPTLLPEIDMPNTKLEYLERQYKTYRHEGIEPLRRAVDSYRIHKTESPYAYVYAKARVYGYIFAKQGAAVRISFSTEKFQSYFDWNDPDENRLKVGNLVALSRDHFKSHCLVGVVAARDHRGGLLPDQTKGEGDETPPRIDVFWARPKEDSQWDPADEMVMIEAKSSYYEPVRYAMLGLQHAATEESRFNKYIVDAHQGDPDHESFDVDVSAFMPPAAETFDESQREAYLRMTVKELAIVQGPPGTGKTFTSVVALQGLVMVQRGSPIVIAAHTNHALDQLLRECMNVGMIVARLGSRTQDELVQQRTLYNIARANKTVKSKAFVHEKSRSEKIRAIEQARNMCFPPGLVTARTFLNHKIISPSQYDSLDTSEWETPEDVAARSRPAPDGIEPGTEKEQESAEEAFMLSWLASQTEVDRSHLYEPQATQRVPDPRGSINVASLALDDSDDDDDGMFEDGPARKITSTLEEKNRGLQGQFVSLNPGMTGAVNQQHGLKWHDNNARQLLGKHDNMYDIPTHDRGAVYRYLRRQLVRKVAEETLRTELEKHQDICDNIKVEGTLRSVEILQKEKIQIIGCTTTGLAKYRGLISALNPKVLLVEEAAETQEPNISSSLVPSLEQVILVGDHQQLAPSVNVPELKEYGLAVSLFERLVKGRVPFTQLQVQRRMAPPIREVVQTFYPTMADHDDVKSLEVRPEVPGVRARTWWLSHRWPDRRPQTSSVNDDEARWIVRLYQYIVQNGLKVNEVTILTFYKAQVERIKALLCNDPFFSRFPAPAPAKRPVCPQETVRASRPADWDSVVRTVDGFQGEQNEVIILSAVRSCSSSGFVSVENRAVVALSRAKRGMYIFGNEETLLGDDAGRSTWGKVFDVFTRQNAVGEFFPLICERHKRKIEVDEDDERTSWSSFKDGGCDVDCQEAHCSDNEHICKRKCHPPGQDVCQYVCDKVLPCKHKCKEKCGKRCKCPKRCDEPAIKEKIVLPSTKPETRTATSPKRQAIKDLKKANKKQELATREAWGSTANTSAPAQPSNFRERQSILEANNEPQLSELASHAVMPMIRETFKQTTTHGNGSRMVKEKYYHQHGELLIDVSIPDEEDAEKEASDEKQDTDTEPNAEDDTPPETTAEGDEADDEEEWLIEL